MTIESMEALRQDGSVLKIPTHNSAAEDVQELYRSDLAVTALETRCYDGGMVLFTSATPVRKPSCEPLSSSCKTQAHIETSDSLVLGHADGHLLELKEDGATVKMATFHREEVKLGCFICYGLRHGPIVGF